MSSPNRCETTSCPALPLSSCCHVLGCLYIIIILLICVFFRAPGIELRWAVPGTWFCSGRRYSRGAPHRQSHQQIQRQRKMGDNPCVWTSVLTPLFPALSLPLPIYPRHVALGVMVLVALILGLVNGPGVWPRNVSLV